MDRSEQLGARLSPRRELQIQGRRPAPLRVSKDSHKIIKKPPLAPPPHAAAPPQPQHPPPVIIYTVSPKVIHIKPSDFMSLVQRLTGLPSSAAAPPNSAASASVNPEDHNMDVMDQLGIDEGRRCNLGRDAAGFSPAGILSPVPAALPPVPANFFSPLPDTGSLGFLHDHSPTFPGSRKGFLDSSTFFATSPGNLQSAPAIPSPNAYWDLFNHLKDF